MKQFKKFNSYYPFIKDFLWKNISFFLIFIFLSVKNPEGITLYTILLSIILLIMLIIQGIKILLQPISIDFYETQVKINFLHKSKDIYISNLDVFLLPWPLNKKYKNRLLFFDKSIKKRYWVYGDWSDYNEILYYLNEFNLINLKTEKSKEKKFNTFMKRIQIGLFTSFFLVGTIMFISVYFELIPKEELINYMLIASLILPIILIIIARKYSPYLRKNKNT